MKKSAKLFIILASAVIAFCFAGCVMLSDTYKNGDEYSAGNTEFDGSRIKSLDISWRSGNITVSRHDKDTVTVTESCGSDLKKEQEVHTWTEMCSAYSSASPESPSSSRCLKRSLK